MIGISWTGTDGSVWDLVSGPVRASAAGITGMGMPLPTDQVNESALQDGQTLTGWKLPPRPVWLPLRFKGAAAVDVEGLQRAFWRSMAIGKVGYLRVTDNAGAVRSLGLRFKDDGGAAYRMDPSVLSDAFGITMIADRPWWEGPAVTRFYAIGSNGAALKTFFGDGAGGDPVLHSPRGRQHDDHPKQSG